MTSNVSRASLHTDLRKCISLARGRGSMNDKFRRTTQRLAVVSPVDHAIKSARDGGLCRILSLGPISIRGAGSAILLNARSPRSQASRSLLWLRARRGSLAQVSTHGERAQVQLQVSLPTAAVGSACARARARTAQETAIAQPFCQP